MSSWAGGATTRGVRLSDLQVSHDAHPDWVSGEERLPRAGETVYCTAGLAEVLRVLGKTGDGSRLLELRLLDAKAPSFFVAASNIRLPKVASGA